MNPGCIDDARVNTRKVRFAAIGARTAVVALVAAAVGCSAADGTPGQQPTNVGVGAGPNAGTGGGAVVAPPGAGGGGVVAPPAGAGGGSGMVPPSGAGGGGVVNPPPGAGGSAVVPPPGAGGVTAIGGTPNVGGAAPVGGAAGAAGDSSMDCGLNTGFSGDKECIKPPPADKGYQLHIGPSNYTNPEAQYILQPGQEATTDFPATSTNTTDKYFFYRQYRLRPTTHHAIITAGNGGITGRRIATANASGEYPTGGIIAPEDKTVGIPLAARTAINVSFHTINTAATKQLRELWINFWYRDASEVTQPATEWFEIGSALFSVPPHTKQTLGPYSCSVSGNGRLLWLYGHRHANNTRFTVTRVRGTQRDVIYDANYWEEPLLLNYNTLVTNPKPDIANNVEGGWSGILDMKTGDRIEWSCDVNNTHDTPLSFTEQTYLGEMCIVDAEGVGANCN